MCNDKIIPLLILGILIGIIIEKVLNKLRKTDPVYQCDLYKAEDCSHVDGPLCDFPECSMLVEHRYNVAKENLEKLNGTEAADKEHS